MTDLDGDIDYAPLTDTVRALSKGETTQSDFREKLLEAVLVLPLRMPAEGEQTSPQPLTIKVGEEAMILAFTQPSQKLAAKVAEVTKTFAPADASLVITGLQPGFGLLVEAEDGAVGIRPDEVRELQEIIASSR